jgi:hypothetical protein
MKEKREDEWEGKVGGRSGGQEGYLMEKGRRKWLRYGGTGLETGQVESKKYERQLACSGAGGLES